MYWGRAVEPGARPVLPHAPRVWDRFRNPCPLLRNALLWSGFKI
ncbi:hypothetical protein BTZ20_1371 [Rhodococcus sp. MTM3W5.2]|nr:hypothetical protein BTZ20_1371 [Rhodococcus sp. MTM3W5.2]